MLNYLLSHLILYMSTAIKEDSEPQEVERVQEKVSSKPLDVPKPKFLKEEDKEATMYITDYMVQESNIDTSAVVDLGLSVKWCGCNLGATKPEGLWLQSRGYREGIYH